MKRSRVGLCAVADWVTLCHAFHRSARGKAVRPDVVAFRADLEANLEHLGAELRAQTYQPGKLRAFSIRDPKPRIIHAPAFRDRVVHHALMAHMAPVIDRSLIDDCYACRPCKGALSAAQRAAGLALGGGWCVHVDIAQYFPSVRHELLLTKIARKFSDHGLLELCGRIVAAYSVRPGQGLPIGALTSQWFANFFLDPIDRLLERDRDVRGHLRYMDDIVWWSADRTGALQVLDRVSDAVRNLDLRLKADPVVRHVEQGFIFCGHRILPGRMLLSKRRRRLVRARLEAVVDAFECGKMGDAEVQQRLDPILASVAHAAGLSWRRRLFANCVAP